ncbi:RagB/SusD family nutrient uptake outer membrane protein [Bacteroides ovatus]|nr:RagB/SusD family nutrient uptake outer membrane protein [Bacteroides ovatus]
MEKKKIYKNIKTQKRFTLLTEIIKKSGRKIICLWIFQQKISSHEKTIPNLMIKEAISFGLKCVMRRVLLNLAEALAEWDYAKNRDDALEALNEVRRRVDLPERTTQEAPDKDSFYETIT